MEPEYVTLSLTRTQYDDLIRAAGTKAGSVSRFFNEFATWSDEAKAEDPGFDTPDPLQEVQTELDLPAQIIDELME